MISVADIRDEFSSFLEQNLSKELLRFTTAGSVDDGKSTLIGRLLHDSKAVYEDQLADVQKSRINRSNGPIDFSLLTDGLRAEREQGITIDVAYRYFATSRRKFIIADTPGHEQYTRNMATGASTADLAVILIDGTKGLLPQTRRHAYISSLLGIPNVLAAVNKMDLLGYREDVFLRLQEDFLALAGELEIPHAQCIPVSALEGDNVVERSERMPWYGGPTLLEHLESVPIRRVAVTEELRFPVQYVIRPDANFRGFAGRVAGGVVRPGDTVVALPSGQSTRIQSIVTYDGELPEAFAPMSVTLKLEDEIDVSRGDMLVSPNVPPRISRHFEAMVVWMHANPLQPGRSYRMKHTTRQLRAEATEIRYRVNVNSLEWEPAPQLEMNDIACVAFEASSPLYFDAYHRNRTTGSFILIDPLSNATVGAGMIRHDLPGSSAEFSGERTAFRQDGPKPVAAWERHRHHGHFPAVILVENRAALASLLERALFEKGFEVLLLDEGEIPFAARAGVLAAMQAGGLVVIYAVESIAPEEKLALRDAARDHFFDLDAVSLPADDGEAVTQVLTLAESLRISNGAENPGDGPGKAN